MIPSIGEDVILNGIVVHVQDRDLISHEAKVGEVDDNGLVLVTKWVHFDYLKSTKEDKELS